MFKSGQFSSDNQNLPTMFLKVYNYLKSKYKIINTFSLNFSKVSILIRDGQYFILISEILQYIC